MLEPEDSHTHFSNFKQVAIMLIRAAGLCSFAALGLMVLIPGAGFFRAFEVAYAIFIVLRLVRLALHVPS